MIIYKIKQRHTKHTTIYKMIKIEPNEHGGMYLFLYMSVSGRYLKSSSNGVDEVCGFYRRVNADCGRLCCDTASLGNFFQICRRYCLHFTGRAVHEDKGKHFFERSQPSYPATNLPIPDQNRIDEVPLWVTRSCQSEVTARDQKCSKVRILQPYELRDE
jgi:hypothetical protein